MTHPPAPDFHLLIAAAGKGERMGTSLPKQYVKINGKSILRHTLDNALQWPGLKSVTLVVDPHHGQYYEEALSGLRPLTIAQGGDTRKQSVFNGLKSFSNLKDENIILVHDAARPFTRADEIARLVAGVGPGRCATLACPVTDTLRRGDESVSRDSLWSLQTPQAFRLGDLRTAHEHAGTTGHTDDTGLAAAAGFAVEIVEGSRMNFKITTPADLEMAEILLAARTETRTAMGFDVHAFEAAPTARRLMLCGAEIPYERALTGHSDADVGLHAITDALLGTIGEGDIGTHFPPSNESYKDMDSAIFLRRAMELLGQRGAKVMNIDVTLICEQPRIGPHVGAMKARVSSIAGIDPARVSIKATTTEKLGFTGRGEGIAAQAVATIRLPSC